MITGSGVRYTGDRHTGGANGSRLSTWASCSPVTQLRPRGIRLASSHHAPAGGDTRGGRNARSCRPTRRSPSSGLTAPGARFAPSAVRAVLGVEPLDLGGELGRLAGQLPRELQRRVVDLAVGDGERHRG